MARRDGITTLCYLERDDKYLMLHRISKKNDINKDKWIGVGGHLEDNESPEECAQREIREETGYDIPLEYLNFRAAITFVSDKGDYELMCLFTAPAPNTEPIDCDEGVLEWVPKDKVFDLNLWEGDIIFLKELMESDKFFSMKLEYDIEDNLKTVIFNGKKLR